MAKLRYRFIVDFELDDPFPTHVLHELSNAVGPIVRPLNGRIEVQTGDYADGLVSIDRMREVVGQALAPLLIEAVRSMRAREARS